MKTILDQLLNRSDSCCEISGRKENLEVYLVVPKEEYNLENCILISKPLKDQIENPEAINPMDWRGLNESMWNENLPVQIVSWRMLKLLNEYDLVEMMYLDEEALDWAKAIGNEEITIVHKDSNGNVLQDGDSVVLIKDLDVKGANFTAKRGAAVHNIKLVWDNAEQIEGKVENQHIVILTQYVKKTK